MLRIHALVREEPPGRLNAKASRDYDLGAKVHVTGLRISDGDEGTYTGYVK